MIRHTYVLYVQGGTYVETYRFSSKMDLHTLLFTLKDDGFLVVDTRDGRYGIPDHAVVVVEELQEGASK
jgi:hypothetical protein